MAAPFEFSEVQAEYILDMPLSPTRLARIDLETELGDKRTDIAELTPILEVTRRGCAK
ncbi:MAG: hypothetical protein R2705_06935 [Ilumatobacteraceae bacterium]